MDEDFVLEQVKISVEYAYDVKAGEYVATIVAQLPRGEDGLILSLLRDDDVWFFEKRLEPEWHSNLINISDKNISTLKRKVFEYIEEQMGKIIKVKHDNEQEILGYMPIKEELTFNL